MSKICTDIKQSKKLLELGIDPETSDMYWRELRYSEPVEYSLNYRPKEMMLTSRTIAFPAWSLSALFELLPKELELLSDEDYFVPILSRSYDDTNKFICCYDNGGMEHWYIEDNPLDAVFKMVCWLLENNYLNKE